MLKFPSGWSVWVFVVLRWCSFHVRGVDPGSTSVYLESSGGCQQHGEWALPARFKSLGLMSPDVHRVTDLEGVWDSCFSGTIGCSKGLPDLVLEYLECS